MWRKKLEWNIFKRSTTFVNVWFIHFALILCYFVLFRSSTYVYAFLLEAQTVNQNTFMPYSYEQGQPFWIRACFKWLIKQGAV